MVNRAIFDILLLFTFSWFLILGGAIVVFDLIIPHHFCEPSICNGIAKGVASTILATLWLGAMVGMRNAFVKRRILKARITPSSKNQGSSG